MFVFVVVVGSVVATFVAVVDIFINVLFFDVFVVGFMGDVASVVGICLLYTSPSPRDATLSRMPSSA